MNTESVKRQLRANGEEFEFDGGTCSIGGAADGPSSIEITHFVVQRDARRQGIASTMLHALYEVMREEEYTHLTVEMQATEVRSREELEAYRAEHGREDPSYLFLTGEEFTHLTYRDDWQWGLLVRGSRYV